VQSLEHAENLLVIFRVDAEAVVRRAGQFATFRSDASLASAAFEDDPAVRNAL
jgi:hypothetical protein